MVAGRLRRFAGLLIIATAFAGCRHARLPSAARTTPLVGPFEWSLPPGFAEPSLPAASVMSAELVELGRHLFFDRRLSGNGTQSCADCHRPELAFTDGRARAVGSTGEEHPRSAMSLVNLVYESRLTWADPGMTSLEGQALIPLLNERPVEMGVSGRGDEVLARLRSEPRYVEMFAAALPDEPPAADLQQIARALAAFERTLVSGRSAYDRLVFEDDWEALSPSAKRGMEMFFSQPFNCAECHGLRGSPADDTVFHDTGVYTTAEYLRSGDTGLHRITGDEKDIGKFKAPTLRNIAVTAPYMHDGSIATLDEAIDHYAAGGRRGRDNRERSELVGGFEIGDAERDDLVGFLDSLTDRAFLGDPRFTTP